MSTRSQKSLIVGSLLFLILIYGLSLRLWSSRGQTILWHQSPRFEELTLNLGLYSVEDLHLPFSNQVTSRNHTTRYQLENSTGTPENSIGPKYGPKDHEMKHLWRSRLGKHSPSLSDSRASHPAMRIKNTSSPTHTNSGASSKSSIVNTTTSSVTITHSRLMANWISPSLNLNQKTKEKTPLQLYAATADPPPGCQEAHCMEYLTESEQRAMKSCDDDVNKWFNKTVTPDDGICNFMDGQKRLPVALASMQGSGNSWVRGILERVTGICTGFSMCDYMMRVHGFIGETIKSGSVLVVKTHDPSPRWHQAYRTFRKAIINPGFGSAIYIVRNPYYSAIAEWNRLATTSILRKNHLPHNNSHINVIPREYFATKEWDTFFHEYVRGWKYRLERWVIKEKNHPVHVLRYEDLQRDTVSEVKKMLNFLNISYNDAEVESKLNDDFTVFHRPHDHNDDFEHYSLEQKELMTSMLRTVIDLADSSNVHVLKLHEYLPFQ